MNMHYALTGELRRCLIVDDEPSMRGILRRLMTAEGFECLEASSGSEALERLAAEPVPLMLSDFHMPGMDGAELLRQVRERWPHTAVVMITAISDVNLAVRCLDSGALDYLTKPFSIEEVRARVAQALEKRRLLLENQAYRDHLEERVSLQARKYEELFLASLQSLADALEVKDAYTWGHSTRVSRYAVAIARELGVPSPRLEQLELGSRLHDIGKIGVREGILNKEGPLTDEEYLHVMEHPVIGWRLLSPLLQEMPHALAVVRSHHERFDGCGSPDALRAGDIPLEARITAVADSFDAMTSGRPYRDGMPVDEAIAELRQCSGTQFDPQCVAAFEQAIARQTFPLPDWSVRRQTRLQIVA
ncbi:MAG TPA: two-component system response regulator [Gemmatimonas aurantiaca]|uniref:Two-component system response regulator n=2 Tax=Gemmatimonas aurantiaca TaxID=173480 RepID=A0A3D4VD04_9BACT|nr:HD domain-containing phosphohydrolase [Gemmatimonas aurantiaca]HCT58518.1 two-component system response regulator [Gemmatimonas aurantiaca]